MAINTEKLNHLLKNFVSSINDVEAVAIVSPDGLPIATYLPSGMDEEHISGMSAAVVALGEQVGVELSTGKLEGFCVEGSNGYAILTSCCEDAVLFVLAKKSAKQGRLMLEIKRIVSEIKPVITSSENVVEDLKDFFAEDLIEDVEKFLSEDLLLQTDLKYAVARLVDQEVVLEQALVTTPQIDNIHFNQKRIEDIGHKQQSGEGTLDSAGQLPFAKSTIEQVNLLEEDIAEQAQLLTELTRRIRESVYTEDVFKNTVKEVRRALKIDRVIIVDLDTNNWDGIVIAESVAPGWSQILRFKLNDPCFREGHLEMYKNGQSCAIDNIYQESGLTDSYIQTLEQFAVKANLAVPIRKNEQLLGLLIAHHCSEARTWEKSDVDLLAQVAAAVGFAVDDEASILKQMEQAY